MDRSPSSEGPEDQHTHGRIGCGQVAQQEQAALVGPLEVVEHQDERLVLTDGRQQAHHGGEQEEPLRVGVGGPGRWRVGNRPPSAARCAPTEAVRRHVGQQLVLGGVGERE